MVDRKELYTIKTVDGSSRGYSILVADKLELIDAVAAGLTPASLHYDVLVAETPEAIRKITQEQLSGATTLIVQGSKYGELKPLVDQFPENFAYKSIFLPPRNFCDHMALLVVGDEKDHDTFIKSREVFGQANMARRYGKFVGAGESFSNLKDIGRYVHDQTKEIQWINNSRVTEVSR